MDSIFRISGLALFLAAATSASAQWLNYRTPGIPRTPSGKPNLAAPAPGRLPGRPDLSGLWTLNAGPGHIANIAADLKAEDVEPWAEALYKQRLGDLGKDDPWTVHCLPAGPRADPHRRQWPGADHTDSRNGGDPV